MEYPATAATAETLANGLTLILDPDPTAPVVSVQIWVETGSMHEDTHLGAGISHFLEHMVFKGTRDFDADTLAGTVQAAGGHWNAYTSFDRTVYYLDGPATGSMTRAPRWRPRAIWKFTTTTRCLPRASSSGPPTGTPFSSPPRAARSA